MTASQRTGKQRKKNGLLNWCELILNLERISFGLMELAMEQLTRSISVYCQDRIKANGLASSRNETQTKVSK